jgi:hypothetical protein
VIAQGIHLSLLLGPTIPVPAPTLLSESLKSAEVTCSDDARTGFQLTFEVGRSGPADLLDYPALLNPLLRPFTRVILIVTLSAVPHVLLDGIVTDQQLSPGERPGSSTLTVTGGDITVMMGLEERTVEHPAQDETMIATMIILSYAQFGLIPLVIPPLTLDPPIPIDRVPGQQGTDLDFLNTMAARFGYAFYIIPGPLPGANLAYWGPPIRVGIPQRALTVNMGHETNVDSISFQYNALAPTRVSGHVQDRLTNEVIPVETFFSTRLPLSTEPAIIVNEPNVRSQQFRMGGVNFMQAFARAQGITDASVDQVVTATGEADTLRYGDILTPRGLVGLRGAGYSYDGLYYVKSVTHNVARHEYKQRFTLTREGVGSTVPIVVP